MCFKLRNNSKEVARIARIAVFIALSVIGAFIKIPSPTGTVALDSCPGYFSVLAFGFLEGAAVISLGHIATSANVGFPLGLLHLLIAFYMMAASVLLRLGYRYFPVKSRNVNLAVGVIAAATFNGLGGLVLSPMLGLGFALALTPSLMFASYVNVVVASMLFQAVKKRLKI